MADNSPSSKSSLRLFVAVDLPDECKERLKSIQKKLETARADVKWVEPRNCHITLKFLGDVPALRIAAVTHILDDCAQDSAAFPLRLDTAGAFPSTNKPDIIWIGSQEGSPILNRLANDIQEKLTKEGFSSDTKPFHAHVTVGRSRSDRNQRHLSSAITSIDIEPMDISIRYVTLFQSILSSDGPRYCEIHRSPLK